MTSSAHYRKDPQKGKNGFSNLKGFTLIEVLIVVAVVAIITSLALPSYRTLIEKRQVTSGAEQIAAFLSSVQMEAVKRSENVTVSYDDDPDAWCIGYVTGTDACDCSVTEIADGADCLVDGQVRIFNGSSLSYPDVLSDMDGDGSFVYDPARGLMLDHTDAMDVELLSDNGSYALNVQLTPTGRVKLCSDNTDQSVPGYDVCTTDIVTQ